jgi:hypothetical protein
MKSIRGTLHFFDHEPHCVGTLIIDGEQYELAGVKRSKVRTDFEGRKIKIKAAAQGDLFDEKPGGASQRERRPL